MCGEIKLLLHGDEAFTEGAFKVKPPGKRNLGGTWQKHDSGDIALLTPKQGTGLVVITMGDGEGHTFTVAASNEAAWLVVSSE